MELSPHRVPPEPSWRKPVGMFAMILYIAVYALLVAFVVDLVGGLPRWLELAVYAAAGLAWILPLRPLLLWMNTGRWRRA